MSTSRITLALSDGALALPEGRIAVFGPPAGFDLSALPRGAVTVISHFAPDVAVWTQAGFDVARAPEGEFAAALVVLPRAKAAAKALIAEAAACAPFLLVDGQKHDGVDSILKAVKSRAAPEGVLSKAHGKLFWLRDADFADWAGAERVVEGFVTRPGVFSADGPDKGSRALIDALPGLKGHVVDLGAGWGYLARHILASEGVTQLDLVEADAVALDCARRNITDPRARFHWADATRFALDTPADVVVSNPPFHVGRAGDPGLGRAFIAAAAGLLKPSGSLWMVANRHLPYEAELAQHFTKAEEIGGTSGFKVVHATRPKRQTRR